MPERKLQKTFEIDAPIQRVWEVLTHLEGYAHWNPFVVEVRCADPGTTPGAMMHLKVQWHDGGTAKSKEEVLDAQPPAAEGDGVRATWIYSFRSWMSAIRMVRSVRTQHLSQEAGGPTVYRSEICLSGWACAAAPLAKIERGLVAQAEALRAEVERKAPETSSVDQK